MIYLGIAAGIFLLDLHIKHYIEHHRKAEGDTAICKDRLVIRKLHNHGAALQFLEKTPWLVAALSGLVTGVMCMYYFWLLTKKGFHACKLALSLCIGGGLSNLYDRLTRGYVVDYVSFRTKWKELARVVFNISDFCIFFGSLLFLFCKRPRKR